MERMRRYRRAVASLLLPVLAAAWVGSAAAACVGMAGAPAAGGDAAGAYQGGPERSAHAPHLDDPHAAHASPPLGAAVHHAADGEPRPDSGHRHGDCPHCLGTPQAPQPEHAACFVADAAALAQQAASLEWDAQLIAPSFDHPAADPAAAEARLWRTPESRAGPGVPLHVRHCVFLI